MKRVIAEWVLTNGKLPGFTERVVSSLPEWNTVGPSGMIVYRAQGNSFVSKPVGSPAPNVLQSGLRPVIATSKDPSFIRRYAGEDCCIFKVNLAPGTRYIDVNSAVTFLTDTGDRALAIKNTILDELRTLCPTEGRWPTVNTPLANMRSAILDRCLGRTKYKGYPGEETIPPEHEVMVYGMNGTFSNPVDIGIINGIQMYEVRYTPTKGGRGRTFRSKAMRRNKNGRRSTHQSRRVRNRNA